ncbi:transporter [Longimicrobium sp.]|uniref:transporter n=1 Tax=Longimicrobium sp. TaxID=2029185 RepID=UPI002E322A6A|nr:transporter [Longimicrobium sp.]HEX6036595.1 transporter [Longimicrobium sp.]
MSILSLAAPSSARETVLQRLNGPLHRRALWVFMAVVLGHWAEHLFQAWQIWVMGMPRHHALGALGMVWPWLVHSEWLHYGYALVMLAGLLVLRPGMAGRARTWWGIALAIQFWHHLEHALLLSQVLGGWRLGGGPAPSSIVQLVAPRVELHLFYNTVVFVPMVVGMAYHLWPSPSEAARMTCSCALHRRPAVRPALGGIVLLALLSGHAPLAGQGMDGAIPRRTLTAGVVLTHEQWDRYWEGTLRRGNENIGTVTTRSAALVAGYGVTDRLSVTAALPYVRTRASRGTLREMHGVQDVQVSARYALLSAPAAGGRATAAVGAAVGMPAGGYSPDFLPLSIGLGSRRVSARASAGWEAPAGWSLGASAAYTWRGTVRLDRDAYYTDGQLHLGNRVAMPDVLDYTLGAGFGRGRLHLPVSATVQRTLGGSDIRRQDMPFVSNRMDFVRVDAGAAYTVPATRLVLRIGAGRVVRGRNVGQATTFSTGLAYALPF